MAFLKVRTIEEMRKATKIEKVIDGKIQSIQQAHVRLQEAMETGYQIVWPTSKLETEGTEKSPLHLGDLTKAQATRRAKQSNSPKVTEYGGIPEARYPQQEGLSGGSCRPFAPYISAGKRHTPAKSSFKPYHFPTEICLIQPSDFAYLVKWLQNHNTGRDVKTIKGTQRNKLSFDPRGDKTIASNRIFEASILLSLFDGNTDRYQECKDLCAFFYSVTLCDFDSLVDYPDASVENIGSLRFSDHTTAFNKLSPFCKSLFIEVEFYKTVENTNKSLVGPSYWFRDGFGLGEILTGGIASSSQSFNAHKNKELLIVTLKEFSNMSLHGQLIIMRNVVAINDQTIEVALNTKNEIGRFGRQYSTMVYLSRLDRAVITSLNGYDMEAAMQTIFLHLLPHIEAPFFKRYIREKTIVRQEISTLMGWPTEYTKEVLQAIVMGQGKKSYSEQLDASYGIYKERDTFTDEIVKKLNDATPVAMYARKRLKDKNIKNLLDFKKLTAKQKRSFMFFYWTFYEREIQDVMISMFKNPLPLHDAVYSQVKLPDMKEVEKRIKEETGIDMKLGIT